MLESPVPVLLVCERAVQSLGPIAFVLGGCHRGTGPACRISSLSWNEAGVGEPHLEVAMRRQRDFEATQCVSPFLIDGGAKVSNSQPLCWVLRSIVIQIRIARHLLLDQAAEGTLVWL